VLATIAEEEVRARLKVREPTSVAEQEGLSAVRCAERLLSLEIAALKSLEAEQLRLQAQREQEERRFEEEMRLREEWERAET